MSSGFTKARLHGGLYFSKPEPQSFDTKIIELPIPALLKIPLKQHQGAAGLPIVEQGEKVLKGQALTAGDNFFQVPVHASSSGYIEFIDHRFIAIRTDGADTAVTPNNRFNPTKPLSKDDLIALLHSYGIVGLGGACFPAAQKIAAVDFPVRTLLINAAECDPIIHCDNALITSDANRIVQGIDLLSRSCQAHTVIIGIEDNKTQALDAIKKALAVQGVSAKIEVLKSVYPSGAETLLYKLCTGDDTRPANNLTGAGVLSFNVATCHAIATAIQHSVALSSRVTTVVNGIGEKINYHLRIGTPIADVFQHNLQLPADSIKQYTVISGGHMMGEIVNADSSVAKSTNCLWFIDEYQQPTPTPCIRCGLCADVCPELLLPQNLYRSAVEFNADDLYKFQLNRCIECGCCDKVCPSHLPLSQEFNNAKHQLLEKIDADKEASAAKQRFERRQQRLLRKSTRAANTYELEINKNNNSESNTRDNDPELQKKQLIEAALQRTRDRKKAKPQRPTDSGSDKK